MERIGFTMKLFPGKAEEYKRRHDAIWPELAALLRDTGISDYGIFLDPATNTLFATLNRRPGHSMDDLPRDPVMRRWWEYMKDIMASNADGSPVVEPLQPMFHME
ncbi:MAG TPA: L-rhamnose mutarotase [Magnetospirillaceae bacterium]|jgi:L-rhamnose mutarotase